MLFYKLDDFMNIALQEMNADEFKRLEKQRQLAHLRNVRTILLPRVSYVGYQAELALSLASGLTLAEELNFRRRASARTSFHQRKIQRFKRTFLENLRARKSAVRVPTVAEAQRTP